MMNLENSVFGLIVMATLQLGITAPAPGEASQATERRHLKEDFTLINRNVCPPSLCRNNDEPTRNASKVKARSLFFQGDIVLSQKLKAKIFSSERSLRHRRAATRDKKMLWKDGLVIYSFNENIDSRSRVALMEAMSHISNNTCITFREKTSRDPHYVIFQSEPGCWAGIGVAETGHQLVNLGEGCDTVGIAIHEIMHALGFWHEQARPDRDAYVTIIRENIAEENLPNFETMSDSVIDSMQHPYDYLSITHYGEYAFSKNEKPTIQLIGAGAKLGQTVGQRSRLSSADISQIREMYGCNASPIPEKCEGWLRHADGRDYRGQLDHTQGGHTCQRWTESYLRDRQLADYSKGWVASRTGQSPDGLGDHNFCRNPDLLRRERPWCYTTRTSPEWAYCDIQFCKDEPETRPEVSPAAQTSRPAERPETPIPPATSTIGIPPSQPVAVYPYQAPPVPVVNHNPRIKPCRPKKKCRVHGRRKDKNNHKKPCPSRRRNKICRVNSHKNRGGKKKTKT